MKLDITGEKGLQEMDIWSGVILASMWRMYAICLVVQLLCLFTYQPTAECSYKFYFEVYFLLPVIVQGVFLLFSRFFFLRKKSFFSDYALDITMLINFNIFIGVFVVIHSTMPYIMVLLLAPMAVVPIFRRKELIYIQLAISGVLYIVSRISILPPVEYWMDEIPGLGIITFMAWAFAFVVMGERVRQVTLRLDNQVLKDSLTHLYNHEAFYEKLEENMELFDEEQTVFSVMVADIDNFKKVNDTYGHAFGDEVIRAVAEVMERNRGSKDFVARYGGEEFAMILPGKSVGEAILMADKIRREFSTVIIESKDGPKNFTISIGVAEYKHSYRTSSIFFEEADKALYQAKEGGKNRVCCNK